MEKWINNHIVYKGNIFSVREGEIETSKGERYPRQVVINPGGVGVVAVVDGSIILIKQFRISIEKYIIEIPAGRLEPGEKPDESARRELMEEVGCEANNLQLISEYYSGVGFSTERMYIFLATDVKKKHATPEVDEDIEMIQIPLAEVKKMLDNGEFDDSKTIIGLREALILLDGK
jgi:ADP-ribose pyrophosphatase